MGLVLRKLGLRRPADVSFPMPAQCSLSGSGRVWRRVPAHRKAMSAASSTARWLAAIGLLAGAVSSASSATLGYGRTAFVGSIGRLSREGIGSRCCERLQQRMYNGNNDKNNNNKDRLDEAYYQRFMGMSEAEVTDDLLPVDLMDVDPGAVDSLRSKDKVDERARFVGQSQGFLNNVKKAMPTSFQTLDDPSMGPRVYIIPQNQGEAPLEVRSIAPGQRKGRKGVIAEIPGRNLGKRRRLMDIPDKMGMDIKRTIKEAPTRLTELQVQNLRNSGTGGRQQPPQQGKTNEFTFPTFPAPPSMMNQQSNKPSNSFTRLSSSSRRGESSMDPRISALSRDWRVWVGLIAAISFLMALINAVSYRSELIVMNDVGTLEQLVRQALGVEYMA